METHFRFVMGLIHDLFVLRDDFNGSGDFYEDHVAN